jgi:SHS2 domain-containing protein
MPANAAQRWEHFAHEADMGVRGCGATRDAAFEQAAVALIHVMCDPRDIAQTQTIAIDCAAPDNELLLVDWLNALIYEMATRHVLFGAFEVHIDGYHLTARVRGEPIDVARHLYRAARGSGCQRCVVRAMCSGRLAATVA